MPIALRNSYWKKTGNRADVYVFRWHGSPPPSIAISSCSPRTLKGMPRVGHHFNADQHIFRKVETALLFNSNILPHSGIPISFILPAPYI